VEEPINSIQPPAVEMDGAAPPVQPKSPYADSSELLVIPRVVFNYGVIAVSFFILGIFIGGIAASRLAGTSPEQTRQIITEAVTAALANQVDNETRARPTGPDPSQRYEASADNDPFHGPEDALVTIVEFGDFRCGYCARFFRETLNPILEDYEGQVRIVFRDYPILGPTSVEAAFAGQCANLQDAFWPYHDLLYENQDVLSRETYIALAEQLELDVEMFTECLDDEATSQEVFADYAAGQQLGITGTPTFYINGRPIIGAQPYAMFVTTIDQELVAANQSEVDSGTS
jgi:protein-disulfide isomerase